MIKKSNEENTVKAKINKFYEKAQNYMKNNNYVNDLIPQTIIYEAEHIILKNEIETFIVTFLLNNNKLTTAYYSFINDNPNINEINNAMNSGNPEYAFKIIKLEMIKYISKLHNELINNVKLLNDMRNSYDYITSIINDKNTKKQVPYFDKFLELNNLKDIENKLDINDYNDLLNIYKYLMITNYKNQMQLYNNKVINYKNIIKPIELMIKKLKKSGILDNFKIFNKSFEEFIKKQKTDKEKLILLQQDEDEEKEDKIRELLFLH